MSQTKLRDSAISRFVSLLILVFPPSFCLKLPNKQPLPNKIVGAQCPAAKHRRSSASALLGAVMSVVRRGTSLTCMVQGSFLNGTLFWGSKLMRNVAGNFEGFTMKIEECIGFWLVSCNDPCTSGGLGSMPYKILFTCSHHLRRGNTVKHPKGCAVYKGILLLKSTWPSYRFRN